MLQQTGAASSVVVTTAVTIGGVTIGLDYEVLIAGFAGGLVSLSFLPPMGMWQRVWTPVTATLTAGYVAPGATEYVSRVVDEAISTTTVLTTTAFGIGLLTQIGIPVFMRMAKRRMKHLDPKAPKE